MASVIGAARPPPPPPLRNNHLIPSLHPISPSIQTLLSHFSVQETPLKRHQLRRQEQNQFEHSTCAWSSALPHHGRGYVHQRRDKLCQFSEQSCEVTRGTS